MAPMNYVGSNCSNLFVWNNQLEKYRGGRRTKKGQGADDKKQNVTSKIGD